ncbi:MAG: hypothetical protein SFV17_23360 [Candidatus Obscuribacter sp.]|nr:hypothetical protein [Candidatus Obscuribacter sp.]
MPSASIDAAYPRHGFRAQGRVGRLQPKSGDFNLSTPKQGAVRASSPEAFRERLLDYLSQSATLTEKALLEAGTVASTGSSSRAARMLDAWLKGRQGIDKGSRSTNTSAAPVARAHVAAPSFASNQVTSGRLAGEAGSTWAALSAAVARQAENGAPASPAPDAPAAVGSRRREEGDGELDLDLELALGLEPGEVHASGLDGVANTDADLSDGDFDFDGDESDSDFVYMPKAQYDLEDRLPDWAPRRLYGEPSECQVEPAASKFFSPGGDPGHERTDEYLGAYGPQERRKRLSGQRAPAPLAISPEGNRGDRMETFPGGASMVKDGLGRVKEIRTTRGDRLEFYYDGKGHLVSFVRIDAEGNIHSRADQDRHGVLVRDGNGRVRAQGEAIHVDPFGCVSISRQDGQYWSLDLVRSVHIERRLLADEFGKWVSMTALFSADGFRMATRFSPVDVEQMKRSQSGVGTAGGVDLVKPHLRSGHGRYRFYGRDGSVIEFCSDRDLEQLKPSGVMPPGSRPVIDKHWGRRQAGTAWESLREYLSNYLTPT